MFKVERCPGVLHAGIDEVGRGCIAGPVVAAAIIIPAEKLNAIAVADSKKCTPKQREQLAKELLRDATAWGVGVVGVNTIDTINILQSTLLAMQAAVEHCWIKPQHVWVDGRDTPKLAMSATAVIGGDNSVALIAAAGIIAKVYRDSIMRVYAMQYPHYHFAKHKGYGTQLHREALSLHGACAIHRRSFAPVSKVINQVATESM